MIMMIFNPFILTNGKIIKLNEISTSIKRKIVEHTTAYIKIWHKSKWVHFWYSKFYIIRIEYIFA